MEEIMKKKDSAGKYTIYVDKEIYKKFKLYAVQKGVSMSVLIEDYMKATIEIEELFDRKDCKR